MVALWTVIAAGTEERANKCEEAVVTNETMGYPEPEGVRAFTQTRGIIEG